MITTFKKVLNVKLSYKERIYFPLYNREKTVKLQKKYFIVYLEKLRYKKRHLYIQFLYISKFNSAKSCVILHHRNISKDYGARHKIT